MKTGRRFDDAAADGREGLAVFYWIASGSLVGTEFPCWVAVRDLMGPRFFCWVAAGDPMDPGFFWWIIALDLIGSRVFYQVGVHDPMACEFFYWVTTRLNWVRTFFYPLDRRNQQVGAGVLA